MYCRRYRQSGRGYPDHTWRHHHHTRGHHDHTRGYHDDTRRYHDDARRRHDTSCGDPITNRGNHHPGSRGVAVA